MDRTENYLTTIATRYIIQEYTVNLTASGQILVLAPPNPQRVVFCYSESVVGIQPSGIRLPSGLIFPFQSGGIQGLPIVLTVQQHFNLPQQEFVVVDDFAPRVVRAFGIIRQ